MTLVSIQAELGKYVCPIIVAENEFEIDQNNVIMRMICEQKTTAAKYFLSCH